MELFFFFSFLDVITYVFSEQLVDLCLRGCLPQGKCMALSCLVNVPDDECLHFTLGAKKLHKSAVTTCTFRKAVQNSIDC